MSPMRLIAATSIRSIGTKNKGDTGMTPAERRRHAKRAARKQRNKPYSVSETWSRIQAQALENRKVSEKTASDHTLITL